MSKSFRIPKYVTMGGVALRYREREKDFWRDAGAWGVEFDVIGSRLFAKSDNPHLKHVNGIELKKTTEKIWRKDNRGYV